MIVPLHVLSKKLLEAFFNIGQDSAQKVPVFYSAHWGYNNVMLNPCLNI